MKVRDVILGNLALVSSRGVRLLGLDLLGIHFKYISGHRRRGQAGDRAPRRPACTTPTQTSILFRCHPTGD